MNKEERKDGTPEPTLAEVSPRPQPMHTKNNVTMTHYETCNKPSSNCNALSVAEMKTLQSILESDLTATDLEDVISLVVNTGIRPGELVSLRWTDVNFDQYQIVIDSKKSGHKRQIPLAGELSERLQARKYRLPDTEFVLGARPASILRNVSSELTKLATTHFKDRRITLHALRQMFNTNLVNAGCTPHALKYPAGFSS